MYRGLKKCYRVLGNRNLQQTSWITTLGHPTAAAAVPPPPPQEPALKRSGPTDKAVFKPGEKYEGFTCQSSQYIPDFNMTAYIFEHDKIKSKYLHIDRNDSNNLFSINFRTTPFDSTGIPHILEHNVLCGSERFPVRDPFFKMVNRSVATFMNAMTGPDYTLYPFSSMNETDYRNLQRVYLDAVFKPNLNYLDFLQEGWRLENTDIKDKNSDYVIKGVVYNEMKGAFSENSNMLVSKFLNEMLPSHTYGHCSGGDPLDIPSLTHKSLVDFHQRYYHPSNATFFSYGNFPAQPSMKYVNEEYLARYTPIDNKFSAIPSQPRWTKPKQKEIVCRFDNMGAPIERQNQIAIGYLMSDITDIYETLMLTILTEVLVTGPNSKFYKNLIEPNFSGGYSQITGLESTIRDTMFVVGLQDVEAKDFDKVQQLFEQTIDDAIAEGFDRDHVDSVLNNFELNLKHQTPKFGLTLLFNLTPILNHQGDAFKMLDYSKLFSEIRQNLKETPAYLQDVCKKYFRNNNHKLVFIMKPDEKFEDTFASDERKLIQQKASELSASEKEEMFKNCQKLAENQLQKDNADVLPCLRLSDVENPPEPINLEETHIFGIPTQICTVDTNNVSYVQGIYDGANLTPDQILLLPLLSHVINQMGTKNFDYRQFDKHMNANTSGINFQTHFAERINDLSEFSVGIRFNSYCLEQNIPKMFEIIHELLTQFNLTDVSRYDVLLKNYLSALTVGIADSGHLYAMQSASALVNERASLKNRLAGIDHIDFMKHLTQTTSPDVILKNLAAVASTLFSSASLKCALNTSEATRSHFIQEYSTFLKHTTNEQQSQEAKWLKSRLLPQSNLHNIMTIPVNYCAKSIETVPYSHADYAALSVLGKILSAKYLLPVCREQNGAYGAGAKINKDGMFSFFSYRDPNSRKTLETFDQSHDWLNHNWSTTINDQVLFEAKLGILQQVDEPIGPGEKGLDYFRTGVSKKLYLDHRRRILDTKHADLQRVSEKFLTERPSGFGKFVLGPENDTLTDFGLWNVKKS